MKKRIDLLLVERGLCESREKAKALIMAGDVFSAGVRIDKAGETVDECSAIEVRAELPYVSRGGLKLEKAVKSFEIDLKGAVCADIGASTGGFTDCMLQHGASKVYCFDVGYGQLAWKLRSDARVVNMERTNARYLDETSINEKIDFFSIDVSFISLGLILPAASRLTSDKASGVCLIKPQFEAGRSEVGKNGVVKSREVHIGVIEKVIGYSKREGFSPVGLTYSPIQGPKGNIEYLIYVAKGRKEAELFPETVVDQAHKNFSDKELV